MIGAVPHETPMNGRRGGYPLRLPAQPSTGRTVLRSKTSASRRTRDTATSRGLSRVMPLTTRVPRSRPPPGPAHLTQPLPLPSLSNARHQRYPMAGGPSTLWIRAAADPQRIPNPSQCPTMPQQTRSLHAPSGRKRESDSCSMSMPCSLCEHSDIRTVPSVTYASRLTCAIGPVAGARG